MSGQPTLISSDLETAKEKKDEGEMKNEGNKVEEVKRSAEEPKKEEKSSAEEAKKAEDKKVEPEQSSTKKSSKRSRKSRKKRSLTRSARQRMSIRRSVRGDPGKDLKATMLTFQAVRDKPDQARVQLLLCNISDRDIFVKLRCNANSNVTALPASSGHISPKSQMRILLNWTMPEGTTQWKDLPMPKILLTTYFMQQGEKSSDEAPTNTRLMARVSSSKQCDPDNSPIEQLLLDAIGKDSGVTGANASTPNTAIPPSMTPVENTPEKKLSKTELEDDDDADNLRWIIIALVCVIIMLLLQK